jgi:hypothetical protein
VDGRRWSVVSQCGLKVINVCEEVIICGIFLDFFRDFGEICVNFDEIPVDLRRK